MFLGLSLSAGLSLSGAHGRRDAGPNVAFWCSQAYDSSSRSNAKYATFHPLQGTQNYRQRLPRTSTSELAEAWVGIRFAGLSAHISAHQTSITNESILVADRARAHKREFMGELTAQVEMSNCKAWYENEFLVTYEFWPQTRSFSYQVLQSSFLKNLEIPTSVISHEVSEG